MTEKDIPKYEGIFRPTNDSTTDDEVMVTIKGRALGRTINWFHFHTSEKDRKKWTLEDLESKKRKDDIALLKTLEDCWFRTTGSFCKVILSGSVSAIAQEDKLNVVIDSLIHNAKMKFKERCGTEYSASALKKSSVPKVKIDIQQATRNKIEKLKNIFEDELLKQIDADEWNPKKMKKLFNDHAPKKRIMGAIRKYFVEDNPDDDMVDAIDAYLEDL